MNIEELFNNFAAISRDGSNIPVYIKVDFANALFNYKKIDQKHLPEKKVIIDNSDYYLIEDLIDSLTKYYSENSNGNS